MLNQSGEAEPACGEPAQFKPGMTMDVACFETRECSTIQFAADRVWKHSIEARILTPITEVQNSESRPASLRAAVASRTFGFPVG